MLIWVIQYISIEDNAGGAKPPAPPLKSYATHHLIPQALYNDEIVIGCGGCGIKPCGAPNLVIVRGFSNGYKKYKRKYVCKHHFPQGNMTNDEEFEFFP